MRCLLLATLQLLALGVAAKRHALLIKLTTPTPLMLQRICGLVKEAAETDFAFPVYLLEYQSKVPMPVGGWCGANPPTTVLSHEALVAAHGPTTGNLFWNKSLDLAHAQEIWWHGQNHASLRYDYLWMMEQDVAWHGNLFDFFASYANWRDDLLCIDPADLVVGVYYWGVSPDKDPAKHLTRMHSGWINGTDGAPIKHCYVFAPRYSASLLTDLYSRHQQSLWAHSEFDAPHYCQHVKPGCSVASMRDWQTFQTCTTLVGDPFSAFGLGFGGKWVNDPLAQKTTMYHRVKQ